MSIPILYPSDSVNFKRLGKGKLGDIISCVISEELNGDYSCEFQYPVTGPHYAELMNGGVILCLAPNGEKQISSTVYARDGQFFDIYKHSLPINGVVTFYATHLSRRLSTKTCVRSIVDASSLNTITGNAYPTGTYNGFTYYNSGSSWATGTYKNSPKSVLACFIGDENSLISEIGGDFIFWTSSADSSINNFYGKYVQHRGTDNGVEIRYGINMTNLESVSDKSGTFNAVVPYWDDGNGNKTFVTGFVVQPTTPITPVVCVPLDCSSMFDTQPSEADLITAAQTYLDSNQPWLSEDTLTVDFVNGAEIDPHGADIFLGDTVHVYWGDAEVAAEMRVVSYKYDVLADRYSELKLGKQQTQFVAVTGDTASGSSGGGGTMASWESETLVSGLMIYRQENMRMIAAHGIAISSLSSLTLSAEDRPTDILYFVGAQGVAANSRAIGFLRISTEGVLTFRTLSGTVLSSGNGWAIGFWAV